MPRGMSMWCAPVSSCPCPGLSPCMLRTLAAMALPCRADMCKWLMAWPCMKGGIIGCMLMCMLRLRSGSGSGGALAAPPAGGGFRSALRSRPSLSANAALPAAAPSDPGCSGRRGNMDAVAAGCGADTWLADAAAAGNCDSERSPLQPTRGPRAGSGHGALSRAGHAPGTRQTRPAYPRGLPSGSGRWPL